jgi:outer membrane protein assembly factor BamB
VVVALGASGKPKWQTEADMDGFMGIVDGVLIVGEREKIRALDPATGAERWSRALGEKSAVLADAKRVFYGIDGTIAVAEAATGTELARMVEAKR